MKNLLLAIPAAALLGLAITPANATSSSEQISLCSTAIVDQGLAPADAVKVKFKNIKGASLKTVTFKLLPLSGEGDGQIVECQIRGDDVVGAQIRD